MKNGAFFFSKKIVMNEADKISKELEPIPDT